MKVSRLARRYVLDHPSVGECLKRGIVNYSALAREICDHYRIEQTDAVSIACRRYSSRLRKRAGSETQILKAASGIKVNVTMQMSVVAITQMVVPSALFRAQQEVQNRGGEFLLVQNGTETTVVTNSQFVPLLQSLGSEAQVRGELAMLQADFMGNAELQKSAGALLLAKLIAAGLPIVEFISGQQNIRILVPKLSMSRGLEILQSILVKPEHQADAHFERHLAAGLS